MTTQLTAEHIARITELRDRLIELGPDRFDMANWFTKMETTDAMDTYNWIELTWNVQRARNLIDVGDCGTAACLAGHALLLFDDDLPRAAVVSDVARYLGMDIGCEYWEADRWFNVGSWPDPWRQRCTAAIKLLPALDYHDEDYAELKLAKSFARRAIEHGLIIEMMDDLIHGRRLQWYDDDTSATDIADLTDAQEV